MIRDDLQRATKCIEINQCSLSLPSAKNLEGVPPYGMVPIMEGWNCFFCNVANVGEYFSTINIAHVGVKGFNPHHPKSRHL